MDKVDSHRSFASWSKLLRCSICLGIYRRPHTLSCGHSFCTSCLRDLARLTREQFPGAPTSRLKLSCPTCRKKTLIVYILRRRLSVNYSIQDFVDNWREQDKKFQKECYIAVRSIATQSDDITEYEADDTETSLEISVEEKSQIPCRVDVMSFPNFEENDESLDGHVDNNDGLTEQSDSASDVSSNGDLVGIWRVERRPPNIDFFSEIKETLLGIFDCRSRLVMAMIWSGYTFTVMLLANGFFPYMILYSFLFFVILYTESAQQRRNMHRLW